MQGTSLLQGCSVLHSRPADLDVRALEVAMECLLPACRPVELQLVELWLLAPRAQMELLAMPVSHLQ